jgi:hypothetical protein
MKPNIKLLLGGAVLSLAALGIGFYATASDHDDGETDMKARSLNLTDLYVFREKDQNPKVTEDNLIFVLNTNPRSVARRQYYFSNNARYEFHITRVADKDSMATGKEDLALRFEFSKPDAKDQQTIAVTGIRDGAMRTTKETVDRKPILTTPIGAAPILQQVPVDLSGGGITLYAGMREDPFFFDVEQFFRVRAGLAGLGPKVGFSTPGYDFTAGYNVSTIVASVPMGWLKASSNASTLDVWETISIPDPDKKGEWKQVERLARPAVNEGLILSNDYSVALNSVGPSFEAAALKGEEPAADIAKPIVAEASAVLKALGNDDKRVGALLGAFLPDVMRIDTTGSSGYANALNKLGSPIRGRLLKDDVIDITLQVLSNGAVKGDNTSYDGPNLNGGHKPLLSDFPYLADPN